MSPTPPALAWSAENCTIGRTMTILGERWTFVVLREVFNGVRRFDDIRRHSGIPRQVLSNRLALLVDQDVLRRVPYQDPGERVRHEYRLTEKGFDLYPVLVAIADWGDRYLADSVGPPVEFEHRDCGAAVHSVLECDHGHRVERPREVVTRVGPGAQPYEVSAAG
ncbi:MAG TPA: helix-turn-helix domain-containing protein [Nocardioides sp.]|nr:helix-turn-helix domain-containing protein [Nocardioides sp.]